MQLVVGSIPTVSSVGGDLRRGKLIVPRPGEAEEVGEVGQISIEKPFGLGAPTPSLAMRTSL